MYIDYVIGLKGIMKELSRDDLRVIHAIFMDDTPTRLSISESIGLSLLKTSFLLTDLEKKGYIGKEGKLQSKTGRPSHIYALVSERFYTIGVSVDIGFYRVLVIDCGKNIVYDRRYDMPMPLDPEEYIRLLTDELTEAVTSVRKEFEGQGKPVAAACAALTGMVDSSRGMWLLGLQVGGVKNIDIAKILEERIGLPFFIDDNSRSIAFLEQRVGKGKNLENFILLYLGKGVGAGIVIKGEVYAGHHGVTGEIGHIPHGNNNYRCSCGNIGCLEAIVSPAGIRRVMEDRLREGVVSSLSKHLQGQDNTLDLEVIRRAAEEGDRFAIATLYELGSFIGDACTTLIKLFNPQRIIISGYSSTLKEFFEEAIKQKITHTVMAEMLIDYRTEFADYELHYEAYGAGLLAFHRFLESRLKYPD